MMMGPTKKKVITTGIIAFIIPVILGSIFFVNYSKKKNEEIDKLKIQSRVIERFVFAENMTVGDIITAEDLVGVQVKAESAPVDSFASGDAALEELVGKRMRINAEKKTIVAKSMLMNEEDTLTKDERLQEFNMITLPSDLDVGDYVDIRITMPEGEDYLVVSGKEVKQIGTSAESNAIFLQLNEEEIIRSTAAIIESYLDDGFKIYANKYVDPSEQLYNYTRVDYVELYKTELQKLMDEKQTKLDGEQFSNVIQNASGEVISASGEAVKITEADIATLDIAKRIGLTEKQTEEIRNALKENDTTVLDLYNDKLVVTREDMINNYPVKTNIANLIKSNPNILTTIKNKYNIAALEAERASLLEFPLYDYDDYGEIEETTALEKLRENLTKEIETQRTARKEYLQALILEGSQAK